jgi:hypothetical protein
MNIPKLVTDLADLIGPILPGPFRAPVKIVSVLVRDASGLLTEVSTQTLAEQGEASGRAAHNAAHLAGTREVVRAILEESFPGVHARYLSEVEHRIMTEVLIRRAL